MKAEKLTVVILTFNEAKHIERCITSLKSFADKVCVCDSYSTDNTVEIALSVGAEVKRNHWVNYASQFNWALDNFDTQDGWIMRMDADEFVTGELVAEILALKAGSCNTVSHCYVKRQVHFMGRWIKHGDYYPIWLLRLWNDSSARCESRWMDEHIKVSSGEGRFLSNDIVDDNKNNLTWWTNKHNGYATREAADLLNTVYQFKKYDDVEPALFGSQEKRKRWLKVRYAKMPLFIRPVAYYLYRYFIRLGFLDGGPGLVWHFLQGFWYRFLVDAKIYEAYHRAGKDKLALQGYVKREWGIEFV